MSCYYTNLAKERINHVIGDIGKGDKGEKWVSLIVACRPFSLFHSFPLLIHWCLNVFMGQKCLHSIKIADNSSTPSLNQPNKKKRQNWTKISYHSLTLSHTQKPNVEWTRQKVNVQLLGKIEFNYKNKILNVFTILKRYHYNDKRRRTFWQRSYQ